MAIGQDGMVLAAKVLAVTAEDLFTEPALLAAAKADFAQRMEGVKYESKIPPNQKPPPDYRNSSR